MRENRVYSRRLMHEDAFLWDAAGDVRRPVVLLDISLMGVAFTSAGALPRGAVHRLQFCLPGHVQRHEAVLEVVHSTTAGVPAGYRVGARFLRIEPGTSALIQDFVGTGPRP